MSWYLGRFEFYGDHQSHSTLEHSTEKHGSLVVDRLDVLMKKY